MSSLRTSDWVEEVSAEMRSTVPRSVDLGKVHMQEEGQCSQIPQRSGFGIHNGRWLVGQRRGSQVPCPVLRSHLYAPQPGVVGTSDLPGQGHIPLSEKGELISEVQCGSYCEVILPSPGQAAMLPVGGAVGPGAGPRPATSFPRLLYKQPQHLLPWLLDNHGPGSKVS